MARTRFLPLMACAAVVCASRALDAQATSRFRVDSWGVEDGLPSAFVNDMVTTSDGYLWLAAGGILARFDGYTFRTFSTATDTAISGRVNSVFGGVGDTVWASLDNGWIVSVAQGHVARFAQLVNAGLTQDTAGTLIALAQPLHRWEDGHFHEIPTPPQFAMRIAWRPIMRRDASGTIWAPGEKGVPLRVSGGRATMAPFRADVILADRARNRVLFSRRVGGVIEVFDVAGVVQYRIRHEPSLVPTLVDRDGRLWVSAAGEMRAYLPGNPDPDARIPVPGANDLDTVLEDATGGIWVAGVGLSRIQEVPFRTITRVAGLSGNARQVDRISAAPDGTILGRVTIDATPGIYRLDDNGGRLITRGFPLATFDARGTRWEVDYPSGGSASVRGKRAGLPDIVMPRGGFLVFPDDPARPGSLWFSDGAWLFRAEPYAPGGPRVADSLWVGGAVKAGAFGRDGTMWIAVINAGGDGALVRRARDSTRTFAVADGYPSAEVRALLPDADGSVWIGTYDAGLVRLRNDHFAAVREQNGLADNVVSQIFDDGAGNFWMAGNRVVHRVRIDDARAFLDGRATHVTGIGYGKRDGLSNPETSGHEGARAPDGRIWLPTFGGAAVVDPRRAIALDSAPPIMHVLGIRTVGDSLLESNNLRLARGQRRVAIAYTGVSLRNPAGVRYEYRLDGVDRDWIRAGAIREAIYNDVRPGTHTFRVRGMNAGGAWSSEDATFAFTVPAYFYETTWFYLALAVLVGVGARYGLIARERQLRRRQVELTGLVSERTSELSRALVTVEAQTAQLRTLDEAKSRFFANVSHEFRTPLSLIQGPVEDVRDGRAGPVTDVARRRLETVLSNVRRLVQLVEQLLDVARLESGTLQLRAEVRDLVPLLRRITESFASLAERRGLSFHVSCPVGGVRVRYDPDQMEKILSNLLGNALKFTPAGGRVELRLHTEGDAPGGFAIIEVEDTGPGIPAAHQSRVFDRFYQVDDSAQRAHEGAGIGLALARELVDLHDGTLALRSVEGAGSTFTVRLPLAASPMHTSAESAATHRALRPALALVGGDPLTTPDSARESEAVQDASADITTVLVAEDNAELLAWLRDRLVDKYRVIEAPNGAVALALTREHVPDLIISDVMMPELDGQSLCEAVKRDPETDFIPVILLTAKASRESRLAGLEGGADDYLAKPVDIHELFARANNLILSRRRLRERYQAANRVLPVLEVPLKPAARDGASEAFLTKLYAAIADHVGDESFQVEALAAAVGMGRSTLYRRVEELLHHSPMDVIWEYRLEQAAQWLSETDANVSEVAYGVGFKSVPHFCSRFRDRFNSTPSAFRRRTTTTALP